MGKKLVMDNYRVVGYRTDMGRKYPVYFCTDLNGRTDFTSDDNVATRFTKSNAVKCVEYLNAEFEVDGVVEKDPIRLGSNAVAEIHLEKIQETSLVS